MISMVNDRSSISEFVQKLNGLFFFAGKEYRSAVTDDCFILENYKRDIVDERILIHFILKSVICPSIRVLMPDILYYTHEHSITDKVFWVCSKYPGRYRKTLLNLLAHMWLTQDQLYKLNHMIDTPEAFCKLVILYAKNDAIAVDDFTSFLADNKKHLYTVNLSRIIGECNLSGSIDKIIAINQVIASLGD